MLKPVFIGVLLITAGAYYMLKPKKLNAEGLELIKQFEGLSLTTYLDSAGLPTIGYGHLIKEGENFPYQISETYAEQLLRQDVARFENAVNTYVTVPLSQNMFNALVSFAYNVGTGNFINSTLLKKLNSGDYIGANQELSRWNKATVDGVKIVIDGLTNRREHEREVFWT